MKTRTSLLTLTGGFLFLWVVTAILSLAITVGGIYIALHFILKFW